MLRPSPYGGTTAVTLLPLTLLVDEGPAAITAGGRAPGAGTAGPGGYSNGNSGAYPSGPADDRAPRTGTGGWPASAGTGSFSTGSFGTGAFGTGAFGTGPAYGDVGQAPATAGYPSPGTHGSSGYDR